MECSIYQNYTASEVLVQGLAGVVNQVSYIYSIVIDNDDDDDDDMMMMSG